MNRLLLAFASLMGWLLLITFILGGNPRILHLGWVREACSDNAATERVCSSLVPFENMAGKEFTREERTVRNCITGEALFNTTELNETFATDIRDSVFTALKMESASERQASFQKVFQKRKWGSNNPPSGLGSTLHFAQEEIAILHSVINDLKLVLNKDRISMLDIPCGDMTWMQRFLDTRDDVDYTGMEIVPELINQHKATFANKPWRFIHQDIAASPLEKAYDLIHTRHMLQHLTGREVFTTLRHFSSSGSGLLLATTFATYPLIHELELNRGGRYRTLNLELPPFSLTRPLCYSRDGPAGWPKYLHLTALWKFPLRTFRKCGKKFRIQKVKLHGVEEELCSCDEQSRS